MRYKRHDITSTLRAARHAAATQQLTVFVWATAGGFTIVNGPPLSPSQSYYTVTPGGEIAAHRIDD